MKVFENFYVFNSKVLSHCIFWMLYYVTFSLIWANGNNYYHSFYLEFILLPIRIFAVYFAIYFLLPSFLFKGKYLEFALYIILMLVFAGFLQRAFIHFFYEKLLGNDQTNLFDLSSILRAVILINSTVLFVMSFKIFKEWNKVKEQLNKVVQSKIEIRANKRIYKLHTSDILYVEGLGNYVTFYTKKEEKLISHLSMKKALELLPKNFVRIHKSYIVNKDHVDSYNFEDTEINNKKLPVGKSYDVTLLST